VRLLRYRFILHIDLQTPPQGSCVFEITEDSGGNMERFDSEERVFRRSEIYDIGELEVTGSEQQGCRPVLIVSSDKFNDYSPEVIILFITSQLDKRGNKYHINLPGVLGLEKKSMVLAEQIRTVDKSRILAKRGQLDLATMNRVDRGLKTILDLRASAEDKEVKEACNKEKMKAFEEWKKQKRLEEEVRRSAAARCASK
jgi:mRNA interferase MazF